MGVNLYTSFQTLRGFWLEKLGSYTQIDLYTRIDSKIIFLICIWIQSTDIDVQNIYFVLANDTNNKTISKTTFVSIEMLNFTETILIQQKGK